MGLDLSKDPFERRESSPKVGRDEHTARQLRTSGSNTDNKQPLPIAGSSDESLQPDGVGNFGRFLHLAHLGKLILNELVVQISISVKLCKYSMRVVQASFGQQPSRGFRHLPEADVNDDPH